MLYITIPIATNLASNTPLDIGVFVSKMVGMVLTVSALAALGYLIMGGVGWITGGGDKGKIEEAKNRITGAIVGLAIVAVSWAIFLVVDGFLGLGIAGGKSSGYTPSGGGSASSGNGGASRGTCIFPTSRCCNSLTDSNCFCQNANYTTATYGSCDAGGSQTGIRCGCVPK